RRMPTMAFSSPWSDHLKSTGREAICPEPSANTVPQRHGCVPAANLNCSESEEYCEHEQTQLSRVSSIVSAIPIEFSYQSHLAASHQPKRYRNGVPEGPGPVRLSPCDRRPRDGDVRQQLGRRKCALRRAA